MNILYKCDSEQKQIYVDTICLFVKDNCFIPVSQDPKILTFSKLMFTRDAGRGRQRPVGPLGGRRRVRCAFRVTTSHTDSPPRGILGHFG